MKMPLNPKVANTVKAIEKVTDTQLALLLLRQVNNNSLTYTLRTSHSLSTKDAVAELTRDVHRLSCITPEVCSQQDIQKAANRIAMPLGPGLGFTHLDKLALPAFQATSSKLQGSSTLWVKTGFPFHNMTPPPTTGVL